MKLFTKVVFAALPLALLGAAAPAQAASPTSPLSITASCQEVTYQVSGAAIPDVRISYDDQVIAAQQAVSGSVSLIGRKDFSRHAISVDVVVDGQQYRAATTIGPCSNISRQNRKGIR